MQLSVLVWIGAFRGTNQLNQYKITWQQKYYMLVAITSAAIGTNLAWVRWRTNETGELYVADSFNHVLRRIRALQVTTVAGSIANPGLRDGVGPDAAFRQPRGIAVHRDTWRLYVADEGNDAVRVVDVADGYRVSTLVSTGLSMPHGIFIAWREEHGVDLYISDTGNRRIRRLDLSALGQMSMTHRQWSRHVHQAVASMETVVDGEGSSTIRSPGGLLIHPPFYSMERYLYVADVTTGHIWQYHTTARRRDGVQRSARIVSCGGQSLDLGRVQTVAVFDPYNEHVRDLARPVLYVTGYDDHIVARLDLGGCPGAVNASLRSAGLVEARVTFIGERRRASSFSFPRGLTSDPEARQQTFFVSDMGHRISIVRERLMWLGGGWQRLTLVSGCGYLDGPARLARFRLARAPCRRTDDAAPTGELQPSAVLAVSSPLVAPPPRLFTLRSFPRSGTTWLLSLLAKSSRVYVPMQQELLRVQLAPVYEPTYVRDVLDRLLRMASREAPPPDVAGISWQHTQFGEDFQAFGFEAVRAQHLQELAASRENATILLVRLSCLKHFVATHHGEPDTDFDPSRTASLRVSRAELQSWCTIRNQAYKWLQNDILPDAIVVAYETLQQHTSHASQLILEHLGVTGRTRDRRRNEPRKAHADSKVYSFIDTPEAQVRAMRPEDFDYQPRCAGPLLRCLFPGGYAFAIPSASPPVAVELRAL